jgi:hypothetical protein
MFQQIIGIPMGTNCAPLLADYSLYYREPVFILERKEQPTQLPLYYFWTFISNFAANGQLSIRRL